MKIRSPARAGPRIEMLPLIDIVFLLLVFFIYAMLSMSVHRGLSVELPVSGAVAALDDEEPTLAVSIQPGAVGQRIYVDEKEIALDDLAGFLRGEAARLGREPGVLLYADHRVSYQELFVVLDKISQAGLSRLSLQADAEAP